MRSLTSGVIARIQSLPRPMIVHFIQVALPEGMVAPTVDNIANAEGGTTRDSNASTTTGSASRVPLTANRATIPSFSGEE
jgi:hypothetical protein